MSEMSSKSRPWGRTNGCHKTIAQVCVLSIHPHFFCSQSGGDETLEHVAMNVNLMGPARPDVRDKQDKKHINHSQKWMLLTVSQHLWWCVMRSGATEAYDDCCFIEHRTHFQMSDGLKWFWVIFSISLITEFPSQYITTRCRLSATSARSSYSRDVYFKMYKLIPARE